MHEIEINRYSDGVICVRLFGDQEGLYEKIDGKVCELLRNNEGIEAIVIPKAPPYVIEALDGIGVHELSSNFYSPS